MKKLIISSFKILANLAGLGLVVAFFAVVVLFAAYGAEVHGRYTKEFAVPYIDKTIPAEQLMEAYYRSAIGSAVSASADHKHSEPEALTGGFTFESEGVNRGDREGYVRCSDKFTFDFDKKVIHALLGKELSVLPIIASYRGKVPVGFTEYGEAVEGETNYVVIVSYYKFKDYDGTTTYTLPATYWTDGYTLQVIRHMPDMGGEIIMYGTEYVDHSLATDV